MDDEQLRVTVYRHFATEGRAPGTATLAAELGLAEAAVTEGLKRLAAQRHLVLRDGAIVMAHPFAAIPLGFSAMGASVLWWGGCAWDAFALPHLVPQQAPVLVATDCPGCERALAWRVDRDSPPEGDEVAHFLVPVAHMWDDVVRTCGNQRLFCSEACVERWLARTGNERGYVMDLATLWRLARGWYEGRLSAGYTRREPAEAKDYFRSVGLEGAFWGL
jgi:Alkylmercury lyase